MSSPPNMSNQTLHHQHSMSSPPTTTPASLTPSSLAKTCLVPLLEALEELEISVDHGQREKAMAQISSECSTLQGTVAVPGTPGLPLKHIVQEVSEQLAQLHDYLTKARETPMSHNWRLLVEDGIKKCLDRMVGGFLAFVRCWLGQLALDVASGKSTQADRLSPSSSAMYGPHYRDLQVSIRYSREMIYDLVN